MPEAVWIKRNHLFHASYSVFSLRALIHEFERRSLKIIHGAEYNAGHKIDLNEITIYLNKQYGQPQAIRATTRVAPTGVKTKHHPGLSCEVLLLAPLSIVCEKNESQKRPGGLTENRN
ncbi:MAG: hypothetical protein C0403_19995 [Desulfobacterium sp.]|nr:hypothetical protein [Desulfobacterium sp.]